MANYFFEVKLDPNPYSFDYKYEWKVYDKDNPSSYGYKYIGSGHARSKKLAIKKANKKIKEELNKDSRIATGVLFSTDPDKSVDISIKKPKRRLPYFVPEILRRR